MFRDGLADLMTDDLPCQLHYTNDTTDLLDVVFGEYHPNQVVALKRANADSAIPLLEGREIREGKATAYVCQNLACQMPVTEAGELATQWNG